MKQQQGFALLGIKAGRLFKHDDGTFVTVLHGFARGGRLQLPRGFTHFGFVTDGSVTLEYPYRKYQLSVGDFFSVDGPAEVRGFGHGFVSSAKGYRGMNVFGGPLGARGRLRYIDGCTDSLLVPPVRKGDPCLNHLHFPRSITQTPHTHPSVRTGIVYRGKGECMLGDGTRVPLLPGSVFVIATNATHSFNTYRSSMDVIAFHPDSDFGPTDDDHPMVNRTMVEGVSASHIAAIRTQ